MAEKRHRAVRRILVLAAVIALAVAVSGLAVAVNFFGIRDLLLLQKGTVGVLDENGVLVPGETREADFISLSGFLDSPEGQALAEWRDFLDHYDQDGSIIAEIGNSPTGFEEKYGLYLVYTQEMADRLEEILEKYDLRLHTQIGDLPPEELEPRIGPFLLEENYTYGGYFYEDGTFRYDGYALLPGYGQVDYQFSRSVRGTFQDVALNVEDLSRYEMWVYETACGLPVSLALGPAKALLAADLGDSVVTLNVLAGTETSLEDVFSSGPLSRQDLEHLADAFDFTVLTPARPPEPLERPDPEADVLYGQTGISQDAAEDFVLRLAEEIEAGDWDAAAERVAYPVRITGASGEERRADSPAELLETDCGALFGPSLPALLRREELFSHDGLAAAGGGAVWFGLTGDGIKLFTVQSPDGQSTLRPLEGAGAG